MTDYFDKTKVATIKLDSIKDYRPLNNHVLILINQVHDEIKLGNGKTLFLDNSFEPGAHAQNSGIIVRVPDKFISSEKRNLSSDVSDWDTEIEVKPGDKVWFDYLTGIECNKIECEDRLYYSIPYHCLYVVKRIMGNINTVDWMAEAKIIKDPKSEWADPEKTKVVLTRGEVCPVDEKGNYHKIIPLNGYLLCTPIIDKEKFIDFEIKKENTTYAIVAYAGNCNKKYRPLETRKGIVYYYDDPEITAGKKIIYSLPYSISLENPLHRSFDGDKEYRIVQRRFVRGIVE